jgi:uncharacterized protein (DUF952 family)
MSEPIFHITTATEWAAALEAGWYTNPSLDDEGFIHTSTARQVPATAARFYADVDDLLLLQIDADVVAAEIKWESSHDDLFPHIYGPLEVSAVMVVRPFGPDPDGGFPTPSVDPSDQ